MCLAIVMEIVEIDGMQARCRIGGVERTVSLFMLQDEVLAPGDYVLVHVGYALQKVTAAQAEHTWAIYDEIAAADLKS